MVSYIGDNMSADSFFMTTSRQYARQCWHALALLWMLTWMYRTRCWCQGGWHCKLAWTYTLRTYTKFIAKHTYVSINNFLFICTTCCNYKAANLHRPSLPVGMCYRTFEKNNVQCEDKITSHLKIETTPISAAACRTTCHFFFVRPLLWHSPLATVQNNSHSITTSVSRFLCNGLLKFNHYAKKITSRNEDAISLHFLGSEEVLVDQQFLALPPSLQWISWPSWKRHFSQHVRTDFRTVRVFYDSRHERYGRHPHLLAKTSE